MTTYKISFSLSSQRASFTGETYYSVRTMDMAEALKAFVKSKGNDVSVIINKCERI